MSPDENDLPNQSKHNPFSRQMAKKPLDFNNDEDETRPFENTAEASKLQGFEEINSSTADLGFRGGGFMIGKNKLQVSDDKLKAAERLFEQFQKDEGDFDGDDPSEYLKLNNKRFNAK